MTKAIAVKRSWDLVPASFGEAMEIANVIAASDFAPRDYKGKPANVMIAVQHGLDLGLKPMQALQSIAVVNGKPSVYGDAALALAMSSGQIEDFSETDDGTTATCTIKRKGLPPVTRTFSVEDAKQAGLLGKAGPWTQYPKRMRQMRARGFALRDCVPDLLMGLGIVEEVQDYSVTVEPVKGERDPLDAFTDEERESLTHAFSALNMSVAQRTVILTKHLAGDAPEGGRCKAILDELRDEYSKRKTGRPARKKGEAQPEKPKDDPKPEPVAEAGDNAAIDAEIVAGEPESAKPTEPARSAKKSSFDF